MAQAAPIASNPAFFALDFDQCLGFIVVAVLPSVFWTALAYVVSASIGVTLSLALTSSIAIGMAAFLTIIFCTLSQNKN